jgi:tetratricopeptide (TPR) repeat protein
MIALIVASSLQTVESISIHRQNDSRQRVLGSGVRRVRGDFELVWRVAELDKEWGISMRFRHPLVLLLGGLLSASSVGCSAVTAVVSDTRPATRQGRGSADKYAAIARVYENQGRYDQAEAMYRRALKQNPNNSEVRNSLQQIASRKAGRSFGNAVSTEAVAKVESAQSSAAETAVALNAKAPEISAGVKATAESELKTAALQIADATSDLAFMPGLSPASFEEAATDATAPTSLPLKVAAVELATVEVNLEEGTVVTSFVQPANVPAHPLVSAEQILAVAETPAEHAELLLNGLKHGDSLETQCLAATLLGDCDRSDLAIREALKKANEAATDGYLRLAICDSRIQRGEHDEVTAKCMVELLADSLDELQIQVCSSMHHFAGTIAESKCASALESALQSESPELRASAAVALGDFPNLPESAKAQLKKMATSDSVAPVRDAAQSSVDRSKITSKSMTAEIVVRPKNKQFDTEVRP